MLRAFAIEPEAGSTYLDAEHIVILMQENRSFDHMFGSLQGVRGFNDPRALRLADGKSVFLQTNAAEKTYAPWRLDIKDTKATWMGSLPHSRESQVDAWNGGRHDGWLDAKRPSKEYAHMPLTMGYYTRQDLPFYYAMADAFTVCDQHYCGAMTSTTPNRLLLWSGTVRDPHTPGSKPYMRNSEVDFGEMTWTTYPERLEKAGVSWKVYQNDLSAAGGKTPEEDAWLSNFTDNALEFFANYNVHLAPKYGLKMQEEIAWATTHLEKMKARAKDDSPQTALQMRRLEARLDKVKREYARSQGSFDSLPAAAQDLHRKAFVTNPSPDAQKLDPIRFDEDGAAREMNVPRGDVLEQFRSDVNESKLPAVSWLVAPENFSDHPSAPWYGAWYVSEVMDILTRNPEVWKKTIFILTYDENDGYFDHAPSFAASDPLRRETGGASKGIDPGLEYGYAKDDASLDTDDKDVRSGPLGLGFRVPMIVASPWTRGGWVNSEVFDHTSTLRFVEDFVSRRYGKQVAETNISPWRKAICGDMTSIFRAHEKDEATLRFLDRNTFVESIQRARDKAMPSGYREGGSIPHQEPGVRSACAIPYEMYADGRLSEDRGSFVVEMRAGGEVFGSRSAGAPFNVYQYDAKPGTMKAATYVVQAGTLLREEVRLSAQERYDIAVHGPNGFFRAFQGNIKDSVPGVRLVYETDPHAGQRLTGGVVLHFEHAKGAPAYTVRITDNAYGAKPLTRTITPDASTHAVAIDLRRQHGWYDVTVTVPGSDLKMQFAGHVETGAASVTDPLMGRVRPASA